MNANQRTVLTHSLPILAVAILLAVLIGWAAVAEIVQSTRTHGLVIASQRTQVVQAGMDGVVIQILVEEGEQVHQGQVLARLDPHQSRAAFLDTQAKVAALKAALVRLHAEVFDRPLVFPKEVQKYPHFIHNQTELYRRRQHAILGDIDALQKSLALAEQELALNEPLLATGDIGKLEIIRLKRAVADITGQINSRRSRYFQDAQTEMTKAEEDLATQEQILADREVVLERTAIIAPAKGLVKNIQTTTPGAKVRAGDVILELLPTGSELIVEVKLKPADLAFVRVGLTTAIKLDSYDYSIYGALRGRVKYISPDVLFERTGQGEAPYYRVQITFDSTSTDIHLATEKNRKIEIQPGMTCVVDIETGYHTVLSYLTKPIAKTFAESMHER